MSTLLAPVADIRFVEGPDSVAEWTELGAHDETGETRILCGPLSLGLERLRRRRFVPVSSDTFVQLLEAVLAGGDPEDVEIYTGDHIIRHYKFRTRHIALYLGTPGDRIAVLYDRDAHVAAGVTALGTRTMPVEEWGFRSRAPEGWNAYIYPTLMSMSDIVDLFT